MSFVDSKSPDISEGLPFLLSSAVAAAAETTKDLVQASGVTFDVMIAGIGFQMACSDTRPYIRESVQVQKDQFDTSREAGEQSLSQYWLRSQTSWHRGAGIVHYEPGVDATTEFRYAESLGLDPWTEGELTLLHKMALSQAVSGAQLAYVTGSVVDDTDVVFANVNGTTKRMLSPTPATFTGVTDALTPVTVAGTKILVGRASSIAAGAANGSTLADLWTGAPSPPVPYWAKSRIIAVTANRLWELTLVGGAWPATSLYDHPDTGWTWTAVVEAPASILAAGYANGHSSIFQFRLEDAPTGSTPKLSQAYQVAELPPGEVVRSMQVYLGRYIGIGTSKGVRVGIIGDNNTIQYGPLIVATPTPVRSLVGSDRFMYAAVSSAHPDGKSGALRVDLSQEIGDNTLRFAYAWDARIGTTGQVDSVAMLGTSKTVVLGVRGQGVYAQSTTDYEDSGWIKTGLIRFGTVEPKAFRMLDVGATIPGGSILIESVERDGDSYTLGSLSSTNADGRQVRITKPEGVQEELAFRFTLVKDPVTGQVPTLESTQIKAIPAPPRQRYVQFPLMCMDSEEDRHRTRYGYEGYAWERLSALEQVQEDFVVVTIKDNTSGETFDAAIDKVSFKKMTPTDPNLSQQGFAEVLFRKLQ